MPWAWHWARVWQALVLVLVATAWLASLAARPLYKRDEARNGEIAREMTVSGDSVTPRLNGFKYFEAAVLASCPLYLLLRQMSTLDMG